MRWWAPEVQKRIDRKDEHSQVFVETRDACMAVCKSPEDIALSTACWEKMMQATGILDQAPPGAYDYLVHVGEFIV
jgi:hypothetical protein